MTDLKIFENNQFGKIRIAEVSDKPYFCGADIARALGYRNTRDALAKHCREDGVVKRDIIDSMGRTQQAKFINEGNLYRLICSSELQSADTFEQWVFDDVLPTIRQHGAYLTNSQVEKILTDPDTIIKIATELKEERTKRQLLEFQIEEDKPKVVVAEAVSETESVILIRELAKILKQNDIDIGEKRLYQWLRENGYLISAPGTDYNMPTQRSMNLRLFRVIEHPVIHDGGYTTMKKTPKVTGKGQIYFLNKFLKPRTEGTA